MVSYGHIQKDLPKLRKQELILQKELTKTKNFAEKIMSEWEEMVSDDNRTIIKDKLSEIGKRKEEIENGITKLQTTIEEIENKQIGKDLMMTAIKNMADVFDILEPYKQKEIIKGILEKAILFEDKIDIAYNSKPNGIEQEESNVTTASNWLPG